MNNTAASIVSFIIAISFILMAGLLTHEIRKPKEKCEPIVINSCWTETFKGSFSMYRIPCPKGME